MEETIRMQILAYLSAYFTTLTNYKNFKNDIVGLYTTQTKNLHNKLNINFLCPLPFNFDIFISGLQLSCLKRFILLRISYL